jgi:hypothetical protein
MSTKAVQTSPTYKLGRVGGVGGLTLIAPHPRPVLLAMPSAFRFNNKWLLLTYPQSANVPLADITSYLDEVNNEHKLRYAAVTETHQDGEPHHHVLVVFDTQLRTRNERFFDVGGKHPNWKVIRTKTHLKNSWEYLHKEGYTEVIGTYVHDDEEATEKRLVSSNSKTL